MPSLSVFSSPRGLPMAYTRCPTRALPAGASATGGAVKLATLIWHRSRAGSGNSSVAPKVTLSCLTTKLLALASTWQLVTSRPGAITTALPARSGRSCASKVRTDQTLPDTLVNSTSGSSAMAALAAIASPNPRHTGTARSSEVFTPRPLMACPAASRSGRPSRHAFQAWAAARKEEKEEAAPQPGSAAQPRAAALPPP